MDNLIDLQAYPVNIVLNRLLKDKTTNKNIIFATESYGGKIHFDTRLTIKTLSALDIRPRVQKSLEEQSSRTRKKAEVFTPSWVCNKMNNHCDSEWFGRENVFNIEQGNTWEPTTGKITFDTGNTWKDYVLSKRLEITCGEAPYIVSRYDAATGEVIPIKERIGILDRKLRVINENAITELQWMHWVHKAYQSVYGYEYQGDNLLIARINLLRTFCEYYKARWDKDATIYQLQDIVDIINWNIWQMDGIHGIVPTKATPEQENEDANQISLFDLDFQAELGLTKKKKKKEFDDANCIECKIYDWQSNTSIKYNDIKRG